MHDEYRAKVYSRLLITRRIEYSTCISSSTNTEYIGDGRGRRVRAPWKCVLAIKCAGRLPRVCERDQTCFCSSGPYTVRVLQTAPLAGRRRGNTMVRKREDGKRKGGRKGEDEDDGNAFRIVGALYLPINSVLPS